MPTETCPTHSVMLYMSGPIEIAKQTLRAIALPGGLCATIDPTHFIYMAGEESGFVVGLRNYPRFPAEPAALWAQAQTIAQALLDATHQHSVMLVAADRTEWISRRPQ